MKKIFFLFVMMLPGLYAAAQVKYTSYTNFNTITCLLEVGNNLWVGTEGGICVRSKSNGNVIATYTTNNGLSNNYIMDIAQDGAGNIWAATQWGLSVFNGVSWQKLYHDQTGICDYRISCAEADLNGNIWIGTFDGIWYNNGSTWTFFDDGTPGITSNWITDIDVDNSGNLWFSAGMPGVPGGVIRYDGLLWTSMTSADGLASDFVETIAVDSHDAVWIGHHDAGIDCYKNAAITHYDNANTAGGLIYDWIYDIDFDAAGTMWAATGWGVSAYDGSTWTHNNVSYSSQARALVVDVQNNKWLGTYNDGLARYNLSGWTQFLISNGLCNNDVWSVGEEKNGHVLIGTSYGLSHLAGFNTWTTYNSSNGISWPVIRSIIRDQVDTLWVATFDGILEYNGTSFGPLHVDNENFNCLYLDTATQDIWAASYHGLYKYSGGTWTHYTTAEGLPDDWVWSVTMDHSGNVWAGTNSGGLVRFDGTTFTTFNSVNSGLLNNWVTDVEVDKDGLLWIITNWGTCTYDGTTWTDWSDWLHMGSLGLMTMPRTVSVDRFNNKWFGFNSDGLAVYDGQRWQLYQTKDGLVSNSINTIYYNEESDQHWIGTKNGVSKVECVPPSADFAYDTVCYHTGFELTHLYSTSTVIDSITRYQWDVNQDGVSDYFTKNISHLFPGPGYYNVRLIASNFSCNDTIVKLVWVNKKPLVSLSPSGTVNLCEGSSILITPVTNEDTTVFLNEHFNTMTLPSGWTQIGAGASNWFASNTPSAGGVAPELIFGSSPHFVGESLMSTLPVNTTGNSSVVLTFKDYMSHYTGSYTIGVKTSSDGVNWNTVWSQTVTSSHPSQQHSIPISNMDVGSPTFRVGFFFSGDSWNHNYWYIDDVVLSKYGTTSGSQYTYLWSTGQTTQNITAPQTGKYSVEVSSANCHSFSDTLEVFVQEPFAGQEVCLVTVDTLYGKNMIVWEKPATASIESFNIYKETTIAGFYQLLETVPYDSSSYYIDYFSNPAQRSDRYKIAVVDTCGNESGMSDEHRTIQLAVSQGVPSGHHLHWNSYEGFPYGTFYIWQGVTPSTLVLIDSIQSSLNDQTYTTPPPGELYYLVTVKKADSCIVTGSKASSGTYTTSVSNMEQYKLISGEDEEGLAQLALMPNPARNQFLITGLRRPVNVSVMDVAGKIIFETDCRENTLKVLTDGWAAGIYTLRVKGEKQVVWRKVVIEN